MFNILLQLSLVVELTDHCFIKVALLCVGILVGTFEQFPIQGSVPRLWEVARSWRFLSVVHCLPCVLSLL